MVPVPLAVRNVYAIQRPSGDARGRIQCSEVIDDRPVDGSHRCRFPLPSRKNRRLGPEAHTAIVMAEVENASVPSLARRTWSGAVSPDPPTWKVWNNATYRPSGEKLKKLSSSSGFTPRPGTAGKVERDRKSTRLNSSHSQISYAVFCLKKKKTTPVE